MRNGSMLGSHPITGATDVDIVLVGVGGLVLGALGGFLVAAHNAKQAAAVQSAIAQVHATVSEIKGAVSATPTDAPKA